MTRKQNDASGARLWSQTQPQHVGLFECAAAGASHTAALCYSIPTGLRHPAQGCEERATLGQTSQMISYPNGVVSVLRRNVPQPLQGCNYSGHTPRVARASQPWAEGWNPFGILRTAARVMVLLAPVVSFVAVARAETISIVIASNAAPRVEFGAETLAEALKAKGHIPIITHDVPQTLGQRAIIVGRFAISEIRKRVIYQDQFGRPGREGFHIVAHNDGIITVGGGDDSGALYGCLELAKRIRESGSLPKQIDYSDKPAMRLRD